MDINNVLLIIERNEREEKNSIILMNDKNIKMLSKYHISLKDLEITSGAFKEVQNGVLMKRCCDYRELSDFYNGKYNISSRYNVHFDSKNTALCGILRQIVRPHYERTEIYPDRGQKVLNANGNTYNVVDVLKKNKDSVDAILIDTNTLNIIVAHGLRNYNISYAGDFDNKLGRNAYEWDSGTYYSPVDKNTNFRAIYLNSVNEEPPRDIFEYRNNLIYEYLQTENIIKDSRYDVEIRKAAKNVMMNKFANMNFDDFDKALMKGDFDDGYVKSKSIEGRNI